MPEEIWVSDKFKVDLTMSRHVQLQCQPARMREGEPERDRQHRRAAATVGARRRSQYRALATGLTRQAGISTATAEEHRELGSGGRMAQCDVTVGRFRNCNGNLKDLK
jgi:hypothetical protein